MEMKGYMGCNKWYFKSNGDITKTGLWQLQIS